MFHLIVLYAAIVTFALGLQNLEPVSALLVKNEGPAPYPKSSYHPYYRMEPGECCCRWRDRIRSEDDCHNAVFELGLEADDRTDWVGHVNDGKPGGCSWQMQGDIGLHWNTNQYNQPEDAVAELAPLCRHSEKFYMMDKGECCCEDTGGASIASLAECRKAMNKMHILSDQEWIGDDDTIPSGCSWRGSAFEGEPGTRRNMHWNTASQGSARVDLKPICKHTGNGTRGHYTYY